MAELFGRTYGRWVPPTEGSITSNRIGAAIDNYQANMYGLGEAITGSDWMKEQRLANEAEAQYQQRNATKLGAVDSWADVNGVGDAANWFGGVAATSLPYIAETAAWTAADVATGGALTPAFLARAGAVAPKLLGGGGLTAGADFATRRAATEAGTRGARAVMGAGVATYPSSVGDILSNQRDESGETNLGMAALGGVPYAATNLLGVSSAIANRSLARNAIGALDNLQGFKGGLARTGASMVGTGFKEGTGETLQEGVNQSFGRMAVNPDQTFFNEEANNRYLESFAGGAALGGAFGSVGGWRRKNAVLPEGETVDDGSTNLLGQQRPDFKLESYQNPQGPFLPEKNETQINETDIRQLGLFDQTGAPTYNADTSFSDDGLGTVKTRLPQGVVIGEQQQEGSLANLQLPEGLRQVLYKTATQKADAGIPLSTVEQQVLDSYNSQPGAAALAANPLVLPQQRAPRNDALGNPQGELFSLRDAPMSPYDGRQRQQAENEQAFVDNQTGDLLQQNPSAMTRTMFNPLAEPTNTGGAPTRGAVAGTIRSLINMQLGGKADAALATALSLDLSKTVGDLGQMGSVLDARQQAVEKSMVSLDKKVTNDSNLLTPEDYTAKREVLENKLLTIEAARALVNEYQRVNTNNLAQEGQAKAQPGTVTGQAPSPESSANIMREDNLQATLDKELPLVDQAVADRRADDTKTARLLILNNLLGQPTRNNPAERFQKALKAAGFADTTVTPEEERRS